VTVTSSEDEILISFSTARARLGVHPATLRRWIAEGRLVSAPQPDGRLLFRLSDVDRLNDERNGQF
jgi:predicted site-specific integrase-resolvase